jgi:hypothetical protein
MSMLNEPLAVLLPSATVFLLLLCNDRAVLGPWVNTRGVNLFTGAVIAVLVMLSIILTAATLFPDVSSETIIGILVGGSVLGIAIFLVSDGLRRREVPREAGIKVVHRDYQWRMPPLDQLAPIRLTLLNRIWMVVLRGYLIVAAGLVLWEMARLVSGSG